MKNAVRFGNGRKEVEFNTQEQVNKQWATGTIASAIIINFDMLCWRMAEFGNQNTWKEKKNPSQLVHSMNLYCLLVIIDSLTQNNFKNEERIDERKQSTTRREKLSKMKLGYEKNHRHQCIDSTWTKHKDDYIGKFIVNSIEYRYLSYSLSCVAH